MDFCLAWGNDCRMVEMVGGVVLLKGGFHASPKQVVQALVFTRQKDTVN